jgi:hypothetical protein
MDDLVLWLVPKTVPKTKLSEAWQNRNEPLSHTTWLQDVLKEGLNIAVKDVLLDDKNTPALRGKTTEHAIEATATENLIEVKVSSRPPETDFPGKLVVKESDFNDMPEVLPFWPPKED